MNQEAKPDTSAQTAAVLKAGAEALMHAAGWLDQASKRIEAAEKDSGAAKILAEEARDVLARVNAESERIRSTVPWPTMAVEQLPAAIRATEQSESLRQLMNLIRARTDVTAKGLAAVGTAAVSAIGYAKMADVFPYHGPWYALAGLGLGVVAMVIAVVVLVRRFEHLADTIITSADADLTRDKSQLKDPEFKTLTREYAGMAELNGAKSLLAYNRRAHRFERIADSSSDPTTAAALRARADAIRAEVLTTQDRAVVYILRERAKRAFFHWKAIVLLVIFLLGWYGTALSADALQAKRADAEDDGTNSSSTALVLPLVR